MIFGYFTLFVALVISAVAAYYSIVGLTAIFSAAVIPIVIMGASLEVGKVTAAIWLKLNWHRANLTYKLYLVPALIFLMLLTSMGIFGFLSKAHSDQSLVSGDVTSKIAIYDEKIKTEKENIEANRKALKQMDEGVDQVLGRSADEKGADKAVALRRSQQKERARLQAEISQSQKSIAELNNARAPIAAEVRKVEAEVGPIKYIAALVYGDNPDTNILERAVRWVIILIVAVFDPLALMLILAAQQSIKWNREDKEDQAAMSIVPPPDTVTRPFTPEEIAALDKQPESDEEAHKRIDQELAETMQDLGIEEKPKYEPDNGLLTNDQFDQIKKTTAEQHPYLNQPFVHFKNLKPMVATPPATVVMPIPPTRVITREESAQLETVAWPEVQPPPTIASSNEPVDDDDELSLMDSAEKAAARRWKAAHPGHTLKFQRRLVDMGKLAQLPWLAAKYNSSLVPDIDLGNETQSGFGTVFPTAPNKGDSYLRVDRLPSVLYKFNGLGWIEVDKALSDRYAHDEAYIDYLISKIDTGEYDPDLLSDAEREQIEQRLTGN
jgi:hypothetical protein